jgi:hypothetical protein
MDVFTGRKAVLWKSAVLSALTLAVTSTSATAAVPRAITDGADQFTPVGAVVHGRVDPNGQPTAAWFQYGATKNYGNRTPSHDAGISPGFVPFAAQISGLKSNTTYHFRMVAENKDGRKNGADRTFKTTKPTTTPVFTPNPVPYGKPVFVSGQIVGTGANGAQVSLFGHPFPYTAPLTQYGNTVVADKSGNYLFVLASALSNSIFEVRGKTTPPFTSAQQQLHVASNISLHTPTRVKPRGRVHFWGIVSPAQDGIVVEIQKQVKGGGWALFTRTALKPRTSGTSRFTTRKRLFHSRVFRAVVHSTGGVVDEGTTLNTHFIRVKR